MGFARFWTDRIFAPNVPLPAVEAGFGCFVDVFALPCFDADSFGTFMPLIFFICFSMKPDDDYSEWDDIKFGLGFPLLIAFTIVCFVFALIKAFI